MDLFGDNALHTWLSAQCVGHGLSVQASVHAMQAALLLPHVEWPMYNDVSRECYSGCLQGAGDYFFSSARGSVKCHC